MMLKIAYVSLLSQLQSQSAPHGFRRYQQRCLNFLPGDADFYFWAYSLMRRP